MKKHITCLIVLLIIGCDSNLKKWMTYDEKQEIEENSNSKIKKLQYKRIQSISTDKNELIKGYENEINLFLESKYNKLEPLMIEKSIPEIQQHIIDGKFTYYDLSLFYISRIYLIEFNKLRCTTIKILEQQKFGICNSQTIGTKRILPF